MKEGKLKSLIQKIKKQNKTFNIKQANVFGGCSTLQQYSRRIYWPEVDQSDRTAKQKNGVVKRDTGKSSGKIITEGQTK